MFINTYPLKYKKKKKVKKEAKKIVMNKEQFEVYKKNLQNKNKY